MTLTRRSAIFSLAAAALFPADAKAQAPTSSHDVARHLLTTPPPRWNKETIQKLDSNVLKETLALLDETAVTVIREGSQAIGTFFTKEQNLASENRVAAFGDDVQLRGLEAALSRAKLLNQSQVNNASETRRIQGLVDTQKRTNQRNETERMRSFDTMIASHDGDPLVGIYLQQYRANMNYERDRLAGDAFEEDVRSRASEAAEFLQKTLSPAVAPAPKP